MRLLAAQETPWVSGGWRREPSKTAVPSVFAWKLFDSGEGWVTHLVQMAAGWPWDLTARAAGEGGGRISPLITPLSFPCQGNECMFSILQRNHSHILNIVIGGGGKSQTPCSVEHIVRKSMSFCFPRNSLDQGVTPCPRSVRVSVNH